MMSGAVYDEVIDRPIRCMWLSTRASQRADCRISGGGRSEISDRFEASSAEMTPEIVCVGRVSKAVVAGWYACAS